MISVEETNEYEFQKNIDVVINERKVKKTYFKKIKFKILQVNEKIFGKRI